MPILRTATGKEYICDFMGVADGLVLYVQLRIDLEEAFNIFRNREETRVLTWVGTDGGVVEEEIGFTEFGGFVISGGQCPVRIRLLKDMAEVS